MIDVVLDSGARMPERAHETDAGLDLFSMESVTIPAGGWATIDTGVHIGFERGTFGKVEPRSGLNRDCGVIASPGVIDEGYTGSIGVTLYNLSPQPYTVNKGSKIAQLVIEEYRAPVMRLVDALGETDRGNNGFGSTGK